MRKRLLSIVVFVIAGCVFGQNAPPRFALTPDVQRVIEGIRAESLRADLSFIASDLLEGRDTPSRGLDIAAEYIAAQFRLAGLEPGGDDGYFQTAHMAVVEPNTQAFTLRISQGESEFSAKPREAFFRYTDALDLEKAPVFKLDAADSGLAGKLTTADIAGKVVILEFNPKQLTNLRAAAAKLRQGKPALVIQVDAQGLTVERGPQQRLVDPEQPDTSAPRVTLTGQAAAAFYASLKPGLSGAVASLHIAAPERKPVAMRNVVGILRGSDPVLRNTSVLLTAHYDHIGVRTEGGGDRIYNGANDDGSGTVSVMEVARALARLKVRPRRSIVFMTFFGEEKGLIGSRYYARHPIWPLEQTIAQLNLEQIGRTDSTEGRQISNAALTGFDFSSLTGFVQRAGELTGIKIYKNARNSDPYFADSDNLSLAEVGVPAHTLCVAFDYPDEHKVGDEWQKIDYANMAKVDRAVALSLVILTETDQTPEWNAENPKTAPYLKAWRERHP
jgi:Peptidase family M28